jgi:hypothetical protein
VKFGTVIDYIEKECRMLIFFKIMPKITIINHNYKCVLCSRIQRALPQYR